MYKLFIVEDEHLEIEAIKLILSQHGENIEVVGEASSGLVAIEEIRRLNPDIILLDINIPEINGIDVLKMIKKEDHEKKVILITAFNEFDFDLLVHRSVILNCHRTCSRIICRRSALSSCILSRDGNEANNCQKHEKFFHKFLSN